MSAAYVRGIGLIASKSGSVFTYYLYNGHGDVVQLVNSGGSVTKTYDYDAFGVERSPVATDANPFRYCGEYFDRETNTIYLRARYYSPRLGRFTQQDSWEFMNPNDPLSLNLYTYGHNNPVRYIDPRGHKPLDEFATPDAAAKDFAKEYNEISIKDKQEYGSVIYKVTEYGKKPLKIFGITIPFIKVKDTSKMIKEYYTYSEPKTGRVVGPRTDYEATVGPSNAPKGSIEIAQIHTHSCYINVKYTDRSGSGQYVNVIQGFSADDIDIAHGRGVDIYVVDPWGNMYKASAEKDYADSIYIFDKGYYKDPRISIQKGDYLDLIKDPNIWWDEYWR